MKRLFLILLFLGGRATFAQSPLPNDSSSVTFDHLILEDAMVIDQWDSEHNLQQAMQHRSLELQLKELKGINLISRGSFAQEVVYRGQQDSRIQVRLNGMRIYSACTDRMDPATSYIVANNLKTAEVASACEAHCSNSGLAGNLNLELKQATFDKSQNWRWGFNQQYHSNTRGLVSALNLENHVGKFAWRLNGTWQKHQNYRAGGNAEVPFSQNQKQNWALNTAYRLSDKELLKLDIIYDLATDVGYPALPMDVGRARAVIAGVTYNSHKGLWKFGRLELKVYHNDVFHRMDDTHRPDVFMHMDMPGWSRTSGAYLNTYDWYAGNHNLSATAEYFTNYRKAEMTMYPDNENEPAMFMLTWPDARIHGFGTGMTHNWMSGKNHLNNSLRIDYETSGITDDFGRKQWEGMGYETETARQYILPQLKSALSHRLSEKHSLNAAISYGQRGPSTSELYGFYLFNAHDGYDYLGNPDLKTEKLFTAELGYGFKTSRVNASGTLFLQRYNDYIFGLSSSYDAMTWGARGVRIYENVPHATFVGTELQARYLFSEKLQTFAKAEYLRGILDQGFNLPLIPPLQGNLGISYSPEPWSFRAQSRWAVEQKMYNSEYGDRYTPGYVLLDLSVGFKADWKNLHADLEIAANNLLDTRYRDHLNWGGIPGMGRNVVLQLQLSM